MTNIPSYIGGGKGGGIMNVSNLNTLIIISSLATAYSYKIKGFFLISIVNIETF